MRTGWVIPATLLLVAPAYAVVINCVNEGNGIVRIDYDSSDEKALPIAFALNLAVDGGATITKVYDYKIGDSNTARPGFGIFPSSMQFDSNGDVADWGSPVISGGAGTPSVTLGMASRYFDRKNAPHVKGTLCRILVDTHGAPMVNFRVTPDANQGSIVLENVKNAKFTSAGTILGIRVSKCSVIAGSKPATDSISVTGFIDVAADKFTMPGSVTVTLSSPYMVNPNVQVFPIDSNTLKVGKYNCTRTQKPLKTSFTFVSKSSKFLFTAKNISLKGLSCPVRLNVSIGSYTTAVDIDETIVNGLVKPIPIKLMMGVKNSLRVDKTAVKRSTKPGKSQFTIKGGFAVADVNVNMINSSLTVALGSQIFTIPAGSFKAGTNKFTCSKIILSGGGVAAANFNFRKSVFTITIKDTDLIAEAGITDFGLSFAGFNEVKQVEIK